MTQPTGPQGTPTQQWPQPGQPGAGPGQQPPWQGPPFEPKKPFFRRAWVLISLALLALIVIGGALSGGGDTSPSSGRDTTTTRDDSNDAAPAADGPTATLPIQNGDWRLDTVTVEDSLGDFSGRARITYTGDDDNGGSNLFTITVFVGGKDVASLQGSASDVAPGKTVTVDLFSTDKYVKGPYKYDFQNDL